MFFTRSTFTIPASEGVSDQGAVGGEASYRVHWAFTDARGSAADVVLPPGRAPVDGADQVSAYGRFNLGGHVGDDLASVAQNRRRLLDELGVVPHGVVYMNQVHGSDVAVVDAPWRQQAPPVDGIVTARPGLGLAVLVADCVPVLLADPVVGVVGAAHAGRSGMTAGVVTATIEAMRRVGARDIQAVVGPSICGRCYEVPARMRAEAARVRQVSASVTWAGTPAIDVAAGVVDELAEARVGITWLPGCTLEHPQLYSHRRNPRTGRFAGVVAIESMEGSQ